MRESREPDRGDAPTVERSLQGAQRLLFFAALLSLVCLDHPATGWGVNSRLGLVFAVVDQGTFSIDAYHDRYPTATEDKAYFEGHYYSDKIIGVSLLALPVYAAMSGIGRLFSWSPGFELSNYVLRVFAVSLSGALSVVLLWRLLVRGGAPPRRALLCVAFVFWGSLWFGFSSVFFPYAPGIAASLAAIWITLAPGPAALGRRQSLLAGFFTGFALLCDMTFGLVAAAVGLVFALRATGALVSLEPSIEGRPALGPSAASLAWAALGGMLPLALFAAYSTWIFGTPTIPYEYEALESFRVNMQQGLMGVTTPRVGPLWFLTLHPYRGIFFWSPILILAVCGAVQGLFAPGVRRIYAGLALWGCISYLTFNSGYYMWWGGWCMGSRFLLPMFALLPLGLCEVLRDDRSPALWWAVVVLGSLSVLASVPLSFTAPETPMVNDYGLVANARFGTDLIVPQFEQWARFFRPSSYVLRGGGFDWPRLTSYALAAALPLWLGASAFRRAPRTGSAFSTA